MTHEHVHPDPQNPHTALLLHETASQTQRHFLPLLRPMFMQSGLPSEIGRLIDPSHIVTTNSQFCSHFPTKNYHL